MNNLLRPPRGGEGDLTGDAVSVCPDITTGMTSSGPADVEWLLESRRRVSRVVDFIPPGPVSRTLHNYMKTFKLRPALLLLMLVGCSELQSAHACDSAVIAVGHRQATPDAGHAWSATRRRDGPARTSSGGRGGLRWDEAEGAEAMACGTRTQVRWLR